jgi:MOSC domain-containing protein YiiM
MNEPDPRTIDLLAVSVGKPKVIGALSNGKPVRSGIRKERVTGDTIVAGKTNLAGDKQADPRVHGGPDKAIYVYPSEHLPIWTAELGFDAPLGPNAFGENLTIAGILETDACIGDVWKWGSALVQISQPRGPCYKLEIALDRPGLIPVFTQSGRTGWYLRVLKTGEAPVDGPIELVERHPIGLTVWEANHARMIGTDEAVIEKALSVPELAHAWSRGLRLGARS